MNWADVRNDPHVRVVIAAFRGRDSISFKEYVAKFENQVLARECMMRAIALHAAIPLVCDRCQQVPERIDARTYTLDSRVINESLEDAVGHLRAHS